MLGPFTIYSEGDRSKLTEVCLQYARPAHFNVMLQNNLVDFTLFHVSCLGFVICLFVCLDSVAFGSKQPILYNNEQSTPLSYVPFTKV